MDDIAEHCSCGVNQQSLTHHTFVTDKT